MADIACKNRLEACLAANDGHNWQRADQRGEAIDKGIFPAKDDGRPHNNGLGKGLTHSCFALALCPAIGRLALRICTNGRHMHQALHARARRCFGNILGAFNMQTLHIHKTAYQIDNGICASNRRRQRFRLGNIRRDIGNLTQIRLRFQIIGIFGAAFRHADTRALTQKCLDHIAAQKTTAAKNRYQSVCHCLQIPFYLWTAPCPRSGLLTSANGVPNRATSFRRDPLFKDLRRAQVVELVDALASGASGRKAVEVRVLSWAPFMNDPTRSRLSIG